jgi:hypothetical protein
VEDLLKSLLFENGIIELYLLMMRVEVLWQYINGFYLFFTSVLYLETFYYSLNLNFFVEIILNSEKDLVNIRYLPSFVIVGKFSVSAELILLSNLFGYVQKLFLK